MPGLDDLSIIIPVTDYETEAVSLLEFLKPVFEKYEIILVYPDILKEEPAFLEPYSNSVRIISGHPGRAFQMNAGAGIAQGKFLLFLHADTKFDFSLNPDIKNISEFLDETINKINKNSDSLFYFDILFYGYNKLLMSITSFGVFLRSRLFKVPFGDQGFCISKSLFHKLGRYPEDVEYGEDHVFIWRVRQAGKKIKPFRLKIKTSARKYKQKGWLYITFLYQYLWIKQAIPEWIRLVKKT